MKSNHQDTIPADIAESKQGDLDNLIFQRLKKIICSDFNKILTIIPFWQKLAIKKQEDKVIKYLEKLLKQSNIAERLLIGHIDRGISLEKKIIVKIISLWRTVRKVDVKNYFISLAASMPEVKEPLAELYLSAAPSSNNQKIIDQKINLLQKDGHYGRILLETATFMKIDFFEEQEKIPLQKRFNIDGGSLEKLSIQVDYALKLFSTDSTISEGQAKKLLILWQCIRDSQAKESFLFEEKFHKNVSIDSVKTNAPLLNAVIEHKADVNDTLKKENGNIVNNNVLINAIKNNHIDTVNLLLDLKADITQVVLNQSYALAEAVIINNPLIVQCLIDRKADVNQSTINGTALHTAIIQNNLSMIQLLVKNKADANIEDFQGYTAFHRAVLNNNKQIIKILLKQNFTDTNDKFNLVLKMLLQSDPVDINPMKNSNEMGSPLWHIAKDKKLLGDEEKNLEKKSLVLKNLLGKTPLEEALKNNYFDIVELLLTEDINKQFIINNVQKNQYNLFDSIINKHYKLAKILLSTKSEKDTIILNASELRIQLKGKWDKTLNGKTEFKLNALHLAILSRKTTLIESLLKTNYSPIHKNECTIAPIKLAHILGIKRIITILERQGKLLKQSQIKNQIPMNKEMSVSEINIKEPEEEYKEKKSSTPTILLSLEPSSLRNNIYKLKQYNSDYIKFNIINDDMRCVIECFLSDIPENLKLNELLMVLNSLIILQEKNSFKLETYQRRFILNIISKNFKISSDDLILLLNYLHVLGFSMSDKLLVQFLSNFFVETKFPLKKIYDILRCFNQLELNKETLSFATCDKFLLSSIRTALRQGSDKKEIFQLFEELLALGFSKTDLKSENLINFLLSSTQNVVDQLYLCFEWKLFYHECIEAKFNPLALIKHYKSPYDSTIASNITYYLAHIRYKKKDLIELKDFFLSSLSDDQSPLSLRIWSLARLGFNKNDFHKNQMDQLKSEFKKNQVVLQNDSKGSALILWSLAVMGVSNSDDLYQKYLLICLHSINNNTLQKMDKSTATQILQAQLWFDFILEAKCKNFLKSIVKQTKPTSSIFHKMGNKLLTRLFQKAKFPSHENEALIGDVLRVDMSIEKLKIVIEFDGPDHDIVTDVFKDILLKKLGYHVIRISYLEVDFYKNDEAAAFLMNKVITPLKKQWLKPSSPAFLEEFRNSSFSNEDKASPPNHQASMPIFPALSC